MKNPGTPHKTPAEIAWEKEQKATDSVAPKKQRAPQGLYALPAEVRDVIDDCLRKNMVYRDIQTLLKTRFNHKTSLHSLSNYWKKLGKKAIAENAPGTQQSSKVVIEISEGANVKLRIDPTPENPKSFSVTIFSA